MIDRLFRLFLASTLLLAACSVVRAADPPKEPPKKDPFEKEIEDYEFFFDETIQKKNHKARNDAAELTTQVSASVRAYVENPVRIAKYVKNLAASPEERDYAMGQLYESGQAVIPELIHQLQEAEHAEN